MYACSSDDASNKDDTTKVPVDGGDTTSDDGGGNTTPDDGGGNTTPDGDTPEPEDDAGSDGGGNNGGSPIEGVTATLLLDLPGQFPDGIQWQGDALYFTLPLQTNPVIVRLKGSATLEYLKPAGEAPLGITYDEKAGKLLYASSTGGGGDLFRVGASSADPPPAATPTKVTLKFDAGAGWESPNDAVVRKSDGTIYVTDPGYQTGSPNNGVYRVSPTGDVATIATFDSAHPNGIGLSPKADALYVTLTEDPNADGGATSVVPSIVKYEVKADGSTGPGTKFAELPPVNSTPDGLAVDTAGNVYVATAAGIVVFSSTGTKLGTLATPKFATNLTFGGADGKTLYIAAKGGLYSATVKVAGLAQ